MKKNFLYTVLVALFAILGVTPASAQQKYEINCPALDPAFLTQAQDVVAHKDDADYANKAFTKVFKAVKPKTNPTQAIALGKFFLENGLPQLAEQCAKQVYVANPQDIPALMLYGYSYAERRQWGKAGTKFDEILALDPNNVVAMKLTADMYKHSNPYAAKDYYQKILEIDPNRNDVHLELADIAYDQTEYTDAVLEYDQYYKGVADKKSIRMAVYERYLMSLYYTQQFYPALDVLETVLPFEPTNIIFRRIKFFSEVNTYDLNAATESVKYITEKQVNDTVYNFLDYNFAGRYFEGIEDYATALEYYTKAAAYSDATPDVIKNYALALHNNKRSAEAIEPYKRYLGLLGDKVKATDEFPLGQIYSAVAKNPELDEATKDKYIAEGDEVFAKCIELDPENVLAVINRARLWVKNGSEPEEMPKKYYEETLKLTDGKEGFESQVYESARYLMFYTFKKDMEKECLNYCDKVLSVRPDDALATQIKNALK